MVLGAGTRRNGCDLAWLSVLVVCCGLLWVKQKLVSSTTMREVGPLSADHENGAAVGSCPIMRGCQTLSSRFRSMAMLFDSDDGALGFACSKHGLLVANTATLTSLVKFLIVDRL